MTDRIVPLTTGDDRIVPLTADTPKLDPKPYRQMLGYSREVSREDAPNTHAYVFDPRFGYSQNPEDYA